MNIIQQGALHLPSLQKYDSAMYDYNKTIQMSSEYYMAYYNRALLHYRNEDMDASCSDMQASYKLVQQLDTTDPIYQEIKTSIENHCNPEKPSYYYQRGIAFFNLGQFDKAEKIYTEGS